MKKILVVCGLIMGGVLMSQQPASAFNFRMSGSFELSINCGQWGYGNYAPPVYFWDQGGYPYHHDWYHAPVAADQPEKKSAQTTGYAPNYTTHYGNGGSNHTVGYRNYSRSNVPAYYYPYPYYGGNYSAPYYWYGN